MIAMQERKHFVLWLYIAIVVGGIAIASSESNIERLRKNLLTNYDKRARPVKDHTDTTTVKIGLAPLFIVDLDEVKHFLTLDGWLKLTWRDERFKWNAAEYGDMEVIHFADHEIWQPDITVYNSHDSSLDPKFNTHALVYPTGDVTWVPPFFFTSRCTLDHTNYPRDRQTCHIVLGSWTHHAYQINLQTENTTLALDHFQNTNPSWLLVDTKVERKEKLYDCCKEPYPSLHFSFVLQRRPPAYLQMVWGPITLCLLLTLAVFWIPPHSGEKILLGGFVMLVDLSLMEYVAGSVPSPANVRPAIAPMLSALLTVMAAVLVEVVVCMNMTAYRRISRPPQFLVNLFSGTCGKLMWVHPPRNSASEQPDIQEDQASKLSPYDEWYLVAGGIDRLLFVIFVIVVIAIPKV